MKPRNTSVTTLLLGSLFGNRAGVVSLVVLLAVIGCDSRAGKEPLILKRTVTVRNADYPYLVYVPPAHNHHHKWPIILFLHGAGERGKNGKQIKVGLGPVLNQIPERLRRFLVVFPQAPAHTRWIGAPAQAAMRALDQTLSEFSGDPDRVYLTGISMGGYGAWHLAIQHRERFAAVVPVCGGIMPVPGVPAVRQLPATIGAANPYKAAAEAMPRVPIWIFHGEKDRTIPVTESRKMFQELKSLGADVRYTEYADVDHDSWDRAYSETQLWDWLASK